MANKFLKNGFIISIDVQHIKETFLKIPKIGTYLAFMKWKIFLHTVQVTPVITYNYRLNILV